MANNNQIYKMSNAGGFKSLTRYYDMLAGNTTWSPWEPQGAYDALATVTVPSGGAATVTFAGIPTGYKHLQIRGISQKGGNEVFMRFNGDTAANYSKHYIYGDGSSATAGGFANQDLVEFSYSTGTGSVFGATIVDILDYQNTNKNKTIRNLDGWDSNGSGGILMWSGGWRSTSAITSISLFSASGTIAQYSQFALYGVR